MAGADLERSAAHYRDLAPDYDRSTRLIDRVRRRAIAALALQPNETVLDAGCGTGWCLPMLASAVGPGGRVIGFDPSPDMLAQARLRSQALGPHIELVRASAEEFSASAPVDAILFSYTHDLMRSQSSLANVLRQARPGARVAATSTKFYSRWLAPLNWYIRRSHRGYITDFEGLEAPWSLLAGHLDDFRVQTHGATQHYVATGIVRAPQAA
jgi:ubiquinone/menaquinone biosynthesis C-methylase UbiE